MHSTFQRIFDDLIKLRSYKELNTLTLDNSYSQWLILRLSFLYGIFLDRPSYGKWGIIEYRINSKRKWKWKNSPLEGVEYEYLMNIQQILEVEIHFFAKFCRFLEQRSKVVVSLAVWYVHSIFGLNLMHYSSSAFMYNRMWKANLSYLNVKHLKWELCSKSIMRFYIQCSSSPTR